MIQVPALSGRHSFSAFAFCDEPAARLFFVSDRTGITAEMLGNSLLTQFEHIVFERVTIPFVDSMDKVADAVQQVNATAAAEGRRPIVVSSVVDEAMSEAIRRDAQALTLDMFQIFIVPLEAELGAKSSHAAGRSHGIANSHEYFARMEAINFTQAYDDGAATRIWTAQVILVAYRAAARRRRLSALCSSRRAANSADARTFPRSQAAGVGCLRGGFRR